MRLPVDTTAVNFVSAGPPSPSVDFETKAARTDENGQALYEVELFALGGGAKDRIKVRVAGEPKGLGDFTPVKVVGLQAVTWSMGERTGVSFRAQKVEAPSRGAAS
jgi:hypothetical protein